MSAYKVDIELGEGSRGAFSTEEADDVYEAAHLALRRFERVSRHADVSATDKSQLPLSIKVRPA